jgi:tetratricopeptide (TPR) repeat protein
VHQGAEIVEQAKLEPDDIFYAAIELASPAERAAYLDQVCDDDLDTRRRVERLLEAHSQAGSFLAARPALVAATTDFPAEPSGTVIGPYKLLQMIGEGGMGAVWMAEQTQPVQRKVALKIIKAGMDSRQVLARFEAERQALALMDHPNIAKVLDGGATAEGRPFFVMELVKGQPITQYCDEHRLTPRQRLDLFVPVCQAIQHAHQRGIIHRDVKPSNVLVAPYDGKPLVKVIDFGVAKATGQRLTEKTLFTELGAVVGTLEYMSPEQAELNNQDIDTRSDIYSLGVLLYELLTGSTPLTRQQLRQAPFNEMLRMIREQEPPKPSTRLSDSKDTLPSISGQRHTEPAKLTKLVRGELDWIVMKALEKDRNRRYETASAFAADVRRYLHDEPVAACPPSLGYRLWKFTRRNKTVLTAGALIALAMILGTAGSVWQAVRATEAGNAEHDARENERQARDALDLARDEKEQQRAGINRDLSDALVEAAGLREKSRTARPDDVEPWSQFRAALRRAEALAGSPLADPALVGRARGLQADLEQDKADRRMVARVEEIRLSKVDLPVISVPETRLLYEAAFKEYGLPVFDLDAEEAARRIAGSAIRDWLVAALDHCAEHDKVLIGRLIPVIQRVEKDRGPWARAYYDARLRNDGVAQAALMRLAKQPEALQQPPITLCLLSELVEDSTAIPLLREAQVRHPADLWINHVLANRLARKGLAARKAAGTPDKDFSDAALWQEVRAFRRVALAARPESPTLRRLLAGSLGYDDEAIAHYSKAIELDPKSPINIHELYWFFFNRGNDHASRQQWDKALADWDRAIEVDPKDVSAWVQKGNCYATLQQWDKEYGVWDRVVELDPNNVFALVARANSYARQKQWHKALADRSKVIELDPKYAQLDSCYEKRASYYEILEQWDKAIADYDKAIELDPLNAVARCARGFCYADRKQWDKARADWVKAIELDPKNGRGWYQRATYYANLEQWDKALGVWAKFIELDPKNARAWSARGGYYTNLKQWDKAIADYDKAIELDPRNVGALCARAMCYDNLQQWDKAIADYDKAIELNPNAFALCQRGIYYAKLNQWDKAIADCSMAIAMDPKGNAAGSFFWSTRAWAYYQLKQWEKALADCSMVIDLWPKGAAGWNNRGLAYNGLNQWDKAIADFTKAIELDPKLASARSNRGLACEKLGQWDKAVADYSKAIELDPKNASPHNTLAWLLATVPNPKLRDPARAVNWAKKAVELAPNDGAYWNTLGVAHYRAGDGKAALAAFEKSMELCKGGDSSDWFVMAMCHEKLGDKKKARQWYERGVEWMDKNNPKDDELRRFRTEAAELLKIDKGP